MFCDGFLWQRYLEGICYIGRSTATDAAQCIHTITQQYIRQKAESKHILTQPLYFYNKNNYYLPAIVSISTKAPIGNDLTAKAERAGHSD